MPALEMPQNLTRKQYNANSLDVDTDERTVTAVISTDIVDREKEVLVPKGAIFENYLKNRVVLWAHDYKQPPIGKALWVKQQRNKISAMIKFAPTEKAEEIYQLFKGGFLNAFSVGFQPLEYHQPTPDEIKKTPEWANASRIYDKWEMWEFSAVPVPANPEALAVAVKSKDVALSQEVADELGLEVEETVYVATGAYVETKGAEDKSGVIVEPVRTDNYITTDVIIHTDNYVDTREVGREIAARMLGRMY